MKSLLRNKPFMILLGIYLVFSIAINLIHPVTTIYVNQLDLPTSYFGFFFATMSFGQFIGAIFWGMISDKIGRKIPMIIGILGYALGQFLFGFVNTIPWLIIVFRVLSGFFVCNGYIGAASLTLDYVSKEERTNALSLITGFNILGMAIGYEVSGALYSYASVSIPWLFIIQIGVCVLTALLILIFVKQTPKAVEEVQQKSRNPFVNFKSLSPLALVFLLAVLVMTIGQINITKYIEVIVIDLGYDASTLGHFTFISGIAAFLASIFIIPLIKRSKTIKEEIVIVCLVVLSSSVVLIEFLSGANLIVMMYTLHLVFILSKTLITPLEQNYLAKFSNEKTYGGVMGSRQSIISLGNMVGPLIGSAIYTKGNSLIIIVSAIIILGSLLVYIPVFISYKIKSKNEQKS